jgi:uncharacterized protein YbjT (DUF2867 family)
VDVEAAMKVVLTGATGLVGEGVLMECLQNPAVEKVLVVGRKSCGRTDTKLTELLVPDFLKLDAAEAQLTGYDACFYCAGISSAGMKEPEYRKITFDTAIGFATVLARLNPQMVMCHVTGASVDPTGEGKVMWARVKGQTENAMVKLPFKRVHNFRPALMIPFAGQKNVKTAYRVLCWLEPLWRLVMADKVCTMHELGASMVNVVAKGFEGSAVTVPQVRALAAGP